MVLRPLKDGDPSGAELMRVCVLDVAEEHVTQIAVGFDEQYLYSEDERSE